MKEDKNKIKEPYSPENTPAPPQIIDPSGRSEGNEGERPVENRPRNEQGRENKSPQKNESSNKRLGESETEIDDETTI